MKNYNLKTILYYSLSGIIFINIIFVLLNLFNPPIVGIADNNDFYRVIRPAGLDYISPLGDNWTKSLVRVYKIVNEDWPSWFSYGSIPVWFVKKINCTFGACEFFDIRTFSLFLFIIFSTLIAVILIKNGLSVFYLLSIWLLLDPQWYLVLNSFYTENCALIGFTLITYLLCPRAKVNFTNAFILSFASVLLITAKEQYLPCLLFIPLTLYKYNETKLALKTLSISGFIIAALLMLLPAYSSVQNDIRLMNNHNTVFYGIDYLKVLPTDEITKSLNLPASMVTYSNTHFWKRTREYLPEEKEALGKLSRAKLVFLYLKNPLTIFKGIDNAIKDFSKVRSWTFGNYEDKRMSLMMLPSIFGPELFIAEMQNIFPYLFLILPLLIIIFSVRKKDWYLTSFYTVLFLSSILQCITAIIGDGFAGFNRHMFIGELPFRFIVIFFVAQVLEKFNALKPVLD